MNRSFATIAILSTLGTFPINTAVAQTEAIQATSPFHRIAASALPDIGTEGSLENFKLALQRQIDRCKTQDLNQKFHFGDRVVTRKQWCVETNQKFLELAQGATDFEDLVRKARDQFEWYQSEGRNGKGEVMFTGYNCPTLQASDTPSEEYAAPLFRKPDDLVQTVENGHTVWRKKNADGSYSMHYSRKEVDMDGALKGKGLELAYTTDYFSVSDLQTEGSGVLMLHHQNGATERRFINYSASNGFQWIGIAQILRQQGVPEEYLSVPGMRRYFSEHPEQMMPTLVQNPSYVYFKIEDNGPYGSDSVLLSPRHSLAIDLRVFPQGAVALFQTQRPEIRRLPGTQGLDVASWKDFTTLAVTQDTGGAIVGPGRVDIYWGDDEYAEQASGRLKQLGTLYLALVPEAKPESKSGHRH
jgi:membrane-bound lytic murein transglycosylase A